MRVRVSSITPNFTLKIVQYIKGSVLENYIKKDILKLDGCERMGIELLVVKDLTSNPKFVEQEVNKLIETISNRAAMRVINENSKSSE